MEKRSLTFEEMVNLPEKKQEDLFHEINMLRNKAKCVNFASLYNAGPPKIAKVSGMSLPEARKLHKTYWERNKGVKLATENFKVKTVNIDNKQEKYVYNPVSKMWLYLRKEKDKFSLINQSTAVYCFNIFLKCCLELGIPLNMQIHDK